MSRGLTLPSKRRLKQSVSLQAKHWPMSIGPALQSPSTGPRQVPRFKSEHITQASAPLPSASLRGYAPLPNSMPSSGCALHQAQVLKRLCSMPSASH